MAIATTPELDRMAELTRDYGRMLNRSTGLCSLWTGACLGALTALTFHWTWERFVTLGRPHEGYALFMLRTQETLPTWIFALAFALPFLWAPVARGLGGWVYPERFGVVRALPSAWLKDLEPLVGPMVRWLPLAILGALALVSGILEPLFSQFLGKPSATNAFLWRAFLAPLMGLVWVWLAPRLRKAEAGEGTVLLFVGGFLLTGKDLSIVVFAMPVYGLLTLAMMGYGVWAHVRYRRGIAALEASALEASDV